jgi:hypothetical protein
MFKNVMLIAAFAVSSLGFSQDYVSRKQHINTINGDYLLQQINTYFTIENGNVVNTDRKKKKILSTWPIDKVWEEGDRKIKVTLVNNTIEWKFVDNFTGKSGKVVFELIKK